MREKLSGRKTVLSNLLSSIKSLWERLDIEQIERELILENDHKYTQPNIEMVLKLYSMIFYCHFYTYWGSNDWLQNLWVKV